jgi:acetyl esterase/lipase
MASALFLIYSFLALFMSLNAIRRASPPDSRFPALWLPAVMVAETPAMWFIIRTVIVGVFLQAGALALPIGQVAFWLVIAAQVLQVELIRRAVVSARIIGPERAAATWWERATAWPYRIPDEVERLEAIEYAPGLTLDLYRLRDGLDASAPVLVYIHGGSWGGGDPRRAFRTVVHHLARRGWAVMTIRYPLSPLATFPDHLVGVKRGLNWVRTAGAGFGLDAGRIALAGGSAGAHLAALAALAHDRHQPGFEDADTSVSAVVALYGIYDFLNRNRARFDWPLIPNRVMKATADDAPDLYREASPIDQVRNDAPPFLVIHGESDSLVPIAEAEHFVAAMNSVAAEVKFLRIRWAQHGFDALGGARTRALAIVIEEFLNHHVRALPFDTESPGAA